VKRADDKAGVGCCLILKRVMIDQAALALPLRLATSTSRATYLLKYF
jgi:hypothetical protein